MKFVNSEGFAAGARQAWHEAFDPGISSIDMREILNSYGVQFTAKGGDGKTMDHCDKGKIQQVVHTIKVKDKVAWAWGMWAYSPQQFGDTSEIKSLLLGYAFNAVQTDKFNPYLVAEAGHLAFIAMQDAAVEGRTGERYRRKRVDMARLLKCSADEYLKRWVPIFFKMKDALKDLDAIALPPVAEAIWLLVDKSNGEFSATGDLADALKTPAEAA